MNDRERLFLAIGGADPELVARSERDRRKSHLPFGLAACGLAAAACLALLLIRLLPLWAGPSAVGPDSQDPPEVPDALLLPEQGREIGTLRLLSYTPRSHEEAVDFLIYVNEEQFGIQDKDGLYSIRSIQDPLPEDLPECGLDIFHLPGTSPDQARQAAEDALKDRCPDMTREELAAALPGSLYLRAGEGLEWDSKQTEIWFVSDGQGGSFIITARYFLEAEEGMGARFRDMVSSFRVVDRNEAVPDWMRSLYETTDRLFPALFANDLSGVSELLTEDADADAYGENVWADITVVSVDHALDDDRDPSSAIVSVKHRLNRIEGDSFNYLTMELCRRDGKWLLSWSGIEK